MSRTKRLSVWLTLGSVLNFLSPVPGTLTETNAQTPVIPATQRTVLRHKPIDVSLDANRTLRGKVINGQGAAVSGARVQIIGDTDSVTTTKTDGLGAFVSGPIEAGTYRLVTANDTIELRVWNSNAAPPKARQQVLVAGSAVVRGQCNYPTCKVANCDGSCGGGAYYGDAFGMFFHPMVIGAAVAAAIAIPLALDDDDDDAS